MQINDLHEKELSDGTWTCFLSPDQENGLQGYITNYTADYAVETAIRIIHDLCAEAYRLGYNRGGSIEKAILLKKIEQFFNGMNLRNEKGETVTILVAQGEEK